MRVGLDVDGVIRDFVGALAAQFIKDYPEHEHRLQKVTAWDLHQFFPIGKEIYVYAFQKRAHEVFRIASALPGAALFTALLRAQGHDIFLITTQPKGSECLTLDWIKIQDIPYDAIAFTDKKHLVDCDIYLDDGEHNLEALAQHGKRAVCFDQPWNQGWKGERVKTYDEFMQLLKPSTVETYEKAPA